MSVLADRSQWARTLRFWEQAALDKIIRGIEFADADYMELLQYLLEEASLCEPTGQRPTLDLNEAIDADASHAMPVRLVSISNSQYLGIA